MAGNELAASSRIMSPKPVAPISEPSIIGVRGPKRPAIHPLVRFEKTKVMVRGR